MSVDSQRGLYVRVAHLLLQDGERHGLLGEFGRQTVSECVKPGFLRWIPNFLSTGFRPYFTTLSLQGGCVPLAFGKRRPEGFGFQWFSR